MGCGIGLSGSIARSMQSDGIPWAYLVRKEFTFHSINQPLRVPLYMWGVERDKGGVRPVLHGFGANATANFDLIPSCEAISPAPARSNWIREHMPEISGTNISTTGHRRISTPMMDVIGFLDTLPPSVCMCDGICATLKEYIFKPVYSRFNS